MRDVVDWRLIESEDQVWRCSCASTLPQIWNLDFYSRNLIFVATNLALRPFAVASHASLMRGGRVRGVRAT